MIKITSASLFFLAAGILTSVSILSAYQVLFAIPLVYYTYLTIKEKKVELPKSSWFLLAFAAVAVISLIINIDIVPKPSKNFGRIKYFLFGIGGIFVFRYWLKEATDQVKKNLVRVFLFSILVAGLYTIWEFFFTDKLRVKTLTDTMRYGYGSAMILLTLLSAILHHNKIKNWFDYKFGTIAFVIGFMGMYCTYTRGGLLGFLCGLPFVLYFFRPKLGLTLGTGAILIVMTLGGFYLFGKNSSPTSGSRFLINKNNNSDVIRRSQWKAAVIAIKERPILGWGFSNFHTQLKRIKYDYNLEEKAYDDAHSHNLFLEVASGTGLIGLTLFLGWVIFWAIEVFMSKGLVRALIFPFGVAMVISGQFEVILDANNASMIFFIYALSSAFKGDYVQQS